MTAHALARTNVAYYLPFVRLDYTVLSTFFCQIYYHTYIQSIYKQYIYNIVFSIYFNKYYFNINTNIRTIMLDRSLILPCAWAKKVWCRCLQRCFQTSPLTPQKSYPKFRNPKTTFDKTINKKLKKTPPGGQGGRSPNLLGVNISFLCEYKPPITFQNFY